LPGNAIHFGLRLIESHPLLQPCVHPPVAQVAILELVRINRQRGPHIELPQPQLLESGRQNTNHDETLIAQGQCLADDLRVTAEAALPEAVAEYYDVIAAGPILLRGKGAAQGGLHAEQPEEAGGGNPAAPPFRAFRRGERETPVPPGAELLDGLALFLPILQVPG